MVYGGSLWHLNDAQLVLKSPNCGEEISPTPLHHQQHEPLIQERMDPCFYVVYTKFWPYHLNVTVEIDSSDMATFFQSCIVQFWWAHTNYSPSFLFLNDRSGTGVVFCCFKVVCSEMLFYIVHTSFVGVVIWVTVAFLSAQTSLAILLWPLASMRPIFAHRAATHWVFSLFQTILCKPYRQLFVKIPVDQQFLK